MDIPREPPRRSRRLLLPLLGVGALVATTVGLSRLRPADPAVERSAITIDTVRRGSFVRAVRAPGTLVPEQSRFVVSLSAGRIERRHVLPGTQVTAGTLLLEMSNPEVQLALVQAEQQLAAAEASLIQMRAGLETSRLAQEAALATVSAQAAEAKRVAGMGKELAAQELISRNEYQTQQERAQELEIRLRAEQSRLGVMGKAIAPQLAAQEQQVARLREVVRYQRDLVQAMQVRAGADGVLREVSVEEGQWVLPGQALARVVRPERLKAVLRVPESQARDIAIGQAVIVDMRTDSVTGRVARIDPAVQGATVAVDVALPEQLPMGARPDLSVDGTIELERVENVLYVGRPVFAQAASPGSLFRLGPDGVTAERTAVRFGRGSVNVIEVTSGVAAGDRVIVSDLAGHEAHTRVRIR